MAQISVEKDLETRRVLKETKGHFQESDLGSGLDPDPIHLSERNHTCLQITGPTFILTFPRIQQGLSKGVETFL